MWFADWLIERALSLPAATLAPLGDEIERLTHESALRAYLVVRGERILSDRRIEHQARSQVAGPHLALHRPPDQSMPNHPPDPAS